eukprot:Gb_29840 [translate_table: standard]
MAIAYPVTLFRCYRMVLDSLLSPTSAPRTFCTNVFFSHVLGCLTVGGLPATSFSLCSRWLPHIQCHYHFLSFLSLWSFLTFGDLPLFFYFHLGYLTFGNLPASLLLSCVNLSLSPATALFFLYLPELPHNRDIYSVASSLFSSSFVLNAASWSAVYTFLLAPLYKLPSSSLS